MDVIERILFVLAITDETESTMTKYKDGDLKL